MLEKMGWSEGEGLGREGAGRREPVSINRPLSLGGHVESRGNNKLCFHTASLGQTRTECEACRAKTKVFIPPRLNMAAE